MLGQASQFLSCVLRLQLPRPEARLRSFDGDGSRVGCCGPWGPSGSLFVVVAVSGLRAAEVLLWGPRPRRLTICTVTDQH